MIKSIKTNTLIRGLFFFFQQYFGFTKSKFGFVGKNVVLTPPYTFSNRKNIFIHDNVGIGPFSFLSATNAPLTILSNCAIAERFTVHTGNHAQVVGKRTTDINEINKPAGYDKEVFVAEDVWIGCNVTLLSGVKIGRGSVIAAGAVVTRDIPPYSIAGGIPCKFIKFRWTLEEILLHEELIYNEEDRLSKVSLKQIFKNYGKL